MKAMLARLFSRKFLTLKVDIHSHLLPGIDDGVKSFGESLEILRALQNLGYQKVITTPHIYSEVYPNTPAIIEAKYDELMLHLKESDLSIEVDYAAEYFIDTSFLEVINKGERILTFGNKYVLMETPFLSKPLIFDEVIFQLKAKGYIPVLAHPERYLYLENDMTWLKEISARGVLLQINLPSLVGVYGNSVKKMALELINESKVSFFGSDLHRIKQLPVVTQALKTRLKKVEPLNDSLL